MVTTGHIEIYDSDVNWLVFQFRNTQVINVPNLAGRVALLAIPLQLQLCAFVMWATWLHASLEIDFLHIGMAAVKVNYSDDWLMTMLVYPLPDTPPMICS